MNGAREAMFSREGLLADCLIRLNIASREPFIPGRSPMLLVDADDIAVFPRLSTFASTFIFAKRSTVGQRLLTLRLGCFRWFNGAQTCSPEYYQLVRQRG